MVVRVDKSQRKYIIECTACGEEASFKARSWREFIKKARKVGWRSIKNFRIWEHRCPDCVQSWALEMRLKEQ
jgi:hypothetical protein